MKIRIWMTSIILIAAIMISGLQSGKKLVMPSADSVSLKAEKGIMVSSNYVKPGFAVTQSDFLTNLPIFSYLEFNGKKLIGTGSVPMIIDINTSDTIAVFDEGETVFHLLPYDKNSFIAIIQPSGAVIRISDKQDTLTVFENKSINFAEVLNSKIHLAVENEMYVEDKGSFVKKYTANDRNISYIGMSGGRYIIGTDGNSRILSFDGKKTDILYSGKKGEVDFATIKNGVLYALVNEVSGASDNMEMFMSYLLRIENGMADTIYTADEMMLGGTERSNGIVFFKSLIPELVFYDFKNVFSCGLLNTQFIMRSGKSGQGTYIITAEPGKIYYVGGEKEEASYVSKVIDFNTPVVVNSIYPETEGKGRFYIRTGDTPAADSTWSDYMLVKPGMPENLPRARYAVIKYDFADKNGKFINASLFYRTDNREPVIDTIIAFYPRIVPDYSLNGTFDAVPVQNPDMYPEYTDNLYRTDQKIIFVKWDAHDPDNDILVYDVYLRDSYGRYPAQKGIRNNYALLFTDVFPEGQYNVEVEANDSLSNGNRMSTASKILGDVMIDNTAPVIEDAEFKMGILTFNAVDSGSFIEEAYYSINGGEFLPALPSDLLFDSNRETFDVKIDRKQNEAMLIMIYVLDAYGNMGKYRKVVK